MSQRTTAARDAGFFAIMRRQSRWMLHPYGWWTERSGSHVVFDRKYRPICRVHPDGKVEIVRSNLWIDFLSEHFINHPSQSPNDRDGVARDKIERVVSRLGLADEIAKRRHLLRQGRLPEPKRPASSPLTPGRE